MAAPVQRIFPRLATSALSFVRKPTVALGGWSQTNLVFALGNGARYVGPESGSAQQTATPLFAAIPNLATHSCLIGQFLGDPLREQTIAIGTWRVAFAARLLNAGATFLWQGRAALLVVDGLTGGRRGTIFDTTAIGSGARAGVGELTCLQNVTGAAVKVRTGDYLCLELGIAVANTAAALAPQASLFCDGAIPISSDGATATDALTVLEAPEELLLSLPQTGEQPNPSLVHAQVVALLKEHWPPHSEVLYAWDEDDAHVKKYFDWLGDIYKLYGFDQVDRIFREISPLTCVEQLDAWEDLLGIAQTRAAQRGRTVAERRRVVLARLREWGPLTLHNLAAIFAQLAAYVVGTRPEVLELDKTDMEGKNLWGETLPAATAVPLAADFDLTNLVRDTPVFLDGGHVSDAGVWLRMVLSSTDTVGLRVQLMGPDYTTWQWGNPTDAAPYTAYPLPSGLTTNLQLRSPAFANKAIHGAWRLWVRRVAGAPAVDLVNWSILVEGKGHGGRRQAKFHWATYLDSSHQTAHRRDVESTLDRITQTYARGFCVYAKSSIPGTSLHRPGRFVPGTP